MINNKIYQMKNKYAIDYIQEGTPIPVEET